MTMTQITAALKMTMTAPGFQHRQSLPQHLLLLLLLLLEVVLMRQPQRQCQQLQYCRHSSSSSWVAAASQAWMLLPQ
jgi:hypothetical protein